MKPVRWLRSLRVGIPVAMLVLTVLGAALGLALSVAHRQTVLSLETSLRQAPHREDLSEALGRLLKLLVGDSMRSGSASEQLAAARAHRAAFDATLNSVQRVIAEQQRRWQELLAASRRRRDVDEATRALFTKLSSTLAQLADHAALEDLSGAHDGDPESVDATRRAKTINAFRERVFELLDLVARSPDPALRLVERYNDARGRVQAAFEWSLAFVLLGLTVSAMFWWQLRRSLWVPLGQLEAALENLAHRDYRPATAGAAPLEMQRMFKSLAVVRERGAAVERDKDREVENRCNQRVRSERLAGIGLLATGVAHEINNPLTAIVGAADGLQWRLSDLAARLPAGDGDVVREYLAMIQSEAKRCRAITTKLLDFARGRDGERALYDITAIVHEVIGMFQHVRQYQSRTIQVSRIDPCRAFCNGPEIKQVILNVVANALQATPDQGRLDIAISDHPDHVEVLFKDTGCGMSAETLEHLFDPFFSTKGPGQGTGLGLSISHAIVEKHHGTLEAVSAGPGEGSTFRLRLPASAAAAEAAGERAAA